MEATKKMAASTSTQKGCDGDRLYYDGCAMILVNGELVAQGSQFSLNDAEVITATIDLEEVRAYRFAISQGLQAAKSKAKYDRIQTDFELTSEDLDLSRGPSPPIHPRYHSVEEEIALFAGCYLCDVSYPLANAGTVLS
jgi:NAD+ synthase (glutamine-hydrolysing)